MAMLPRDDGGDGKEEGRHPRQHLAPRNYEDILKFAVENTVPGENDGSTEVLSGERKVWLEQALSGMFTDEVKVMKEKLVELEGIDSDREEDVEKRSELLDYIADLCDNIDNAKDFIKIGGLKALYRCMDDDSPEVRWRALHLAATILQNNEFVQNHLLEAKAMERFLKMADSDPSDMVKIKAIYALSCHIREHDASSEVFVQSDGFSCLIKAMQSPNEKLQIKAAFLLRALLIAQPKYKDEAQKIGMVQQLIGLLDRDHSHTHEHIVAALQCLATDHPRSLDDCRRAQYRLKEILRERVKLIKGKEEFEEEHQHCEELLSMVFPADCQNDPSVER